MSVPFPGNDVQVVDPKTGLMNQVWYDYFQFHQRLAQLPDVSTTAPTNGQVLTYVAATQKWTPA